MRIVWITTQHPPKSGGLAQSSGRITASLRKRGHLLTVLHLSRKVPRLDPLRQGLVIVPEPADLAEPERIFWDHQDLLSQSLLVGFGGNPAGYYAALWAGWLGTKSLVLFRGNDFEKLIHDTKQSWLTHFILTHANGVGAVSREMVCRIQTLRQGPVWYTPNSIDMNEWQALASDRQKARDFKKARFPLDRPVIGMFGELKSKKGLALAKTLFAELGLGDRAYLLTVGHVPATMAQSLEKACPRAWVHLPFQKRGDLPWLYLACDLVLLPSLYDGMPNVLLEAMALGRMVAASRAGAMPDLIESGKNGFLFDPRNPLKAEAVLSSILKMPEAKSAQIGEAAQTRVRERFTPKQEARIIEQALIAIQINDPG